MRLIAVLMLTSLGLVVAGQPRITAAGTKLAELPAGDRNHHWTKSLVASADGRNLYVGVGSNSNVGEGGMENETGRAAIWEVDPRTGRTRVFATGLRNPARLAWEPVTGALWVSVNERDEIGGDLVPDYMTSVRDGGFYGWPYSYYGGHVDDRPQPPRPDVVATAIVPDYALGADEVGNVVWRVSKAPSQVLQGRTRDCSGP